MSSLRTRRFGSRTSPTRCADPIRTLARLFREHPAWIDAARHIDDRAESAVFFSHVPGRSWRLLRRRGKTLLLPGRAHDPDFMFRFTPGAVARLAAVQGDVGDFAVELFSCIAEPRRGRRVDFRIVAPFTRLAERGYVRALLAAGPKVLAFGFARGVLTLGDLRVLVEHARRGRPARWERAACPGVRERRRQRCRGLDARRFERRLIASPPLRRALDGLRRRARRPPLELPPA